MILPAVMAAVAGAAVGSGVGTAALRATRGVDFVWGRSRCDGCGRTLGALQTLPMVSFAVARGACPACGARIDPVHPVAEAAGALAGAALVLGAAAWPAAMAMGVMGAVLLASAVIDWRTRRLPDLLTVMVAVAGAYLAALRGPEALMAGSVAAAVAGAVLLAVRHVLSRARGRQALGLGDVKLVCALALWLGVQTPLMVAAASILALGAWAIRPPADGRIPFGPMIAAAGWTIGFAMEVGLWPG